MARVCGVMAARTAAGSMFRVSGSTSTSTGRAPTCSITFTEAVKVSGVVMTSSPAPGALALNSCTAGLHTALATLGVGAGDEVITTPLTFTASVNVIEHVGARPVLVDVEPDTLNIDPAAVRAAITPHTRAILPVHYAGHPVDLDAIHDAARGVGAAVIEDAAHALPARYRSRWIGSGPNPVASSFYATKNLTTG